MSDVTRLLDAAAAGDRQAAADLMPLVYDELRRLAALGQKKYTDAEPLLLAGYEGMKQREKTIPEQGKVRLTEALDRMIELSTATNKPDEVTKWRAERAKYSATSQAGQCVVAWRSSRCTAVGTIAIP